MGIAFFYGHCGKHPLYALGRCMGRDAGDKKVGVISIEVYKK